jgi:hypothetical protein
MPALTQRIEATKLLEDTNAEGRDSGLAVLPLCAKQLESLREIVLFLEPCRDCNDGFEGVDLGVQVGLRGGTGDTLDC